MLDTLKSSIKDEGDRIQMHFEFRALVLDKKKIATDDYFYVFGLYRTRDYDFQTFAAPTMKGLLFSRDEAAYTFRVLADKATAVMGDDILESVEAFRKTHPKPTCGPPPQIFPPGKEVKPGPGPAGQTLPGTRELVTPEKRQEVINTIKKAMSKRKLSSMHIFRMADQADTGSVSIITLKQVMQTMLPDVQPETVFTLLKILDSNRDGFMERAEYEIIMMDSAEDLQDISDNDSRLEINQKDQGKIGSPVNNDGGRDNDSQISDVPSPRNKPGYQDARQPSSPVNIDAENPADVAQKLGVVLLGLDFKPEEVFDGVDPEQQGFIPVVVAVDMFKYYTDNSINRQTLFKAARHLDSNRDGFIHRADFITGLSSKGGQKPSGTSPSPSNKPVTQPTNAPIIPLPVIPTPATPVLSPGGKVIAKPAKDPNARETWKSPPPLSDGKFYEQVRDLKSLMQAKLIPLEGIFDSDETPVTTLATRLHAILPEYSRPSLVQLLRYVDVQNNGTISRDEFELMMGYNKATGEIEQSQIFDDNKIDTTVIEQVKNMLQKKNISPEDLFKSCDSNQDRLINILDLKQGLESTLNPDEKSYRAVIAFVREVKSVYKTSNFSLPKLILFMTEPAKANIHQSFDTVRRQIDSIASPQGVVADAIVKLRKAIMAVPGNTVEMAAERFDSNKDGVMTIPEFRSFLETLPLAQLSEEQKVFVSNLADKDRDGMIHYDEFIKFLRIDALLEEMQGGLRFPLNTGQLSPVGDKQPSLQKQNPSPMMKTEKIVGTQAAPAMPQRKSFSIKSGSRQASVAGTPKSVKSGKQSVSALSKEGSMAMSENFDEPKGSPPAKNFNDDYAQDFDEDF